MAVPINKTIEPIINHNININFITFDKLQLSIECKDNKKIIDDWTDFSVTVQLLDDRSPIPFDQILKHK